jgi:HEAT repeat protein
LATKAVPAIVSLLLADDSTRGERIAAANALGKIGEANAIDSLVQASLVSQQREKTSIDTALESPDPQYRAGFYINRISADEFELRAAIAQAIGQIGGARAIQALIEMLVAEKGAMESSVKSSVRSAMSVALQKPDALPALHQATKHSSAQVRYWAANYLGDYSDSASVDALLRAAYDENESFDVRQIALIGLSKVGDARVIPYLEDLTHDANLGVARDAKQCAAAIRARIKFST